MSRTLTDPVIPGDPVVKEIQAEAKDVISNKVLPAFKNLQIYLETEYANHTRPGPGILVLPQGAIMYQAYLEYHTTIAGITPGKAKLEFMNYFFTFLNCAYLYLSCCQMARQGFFPKS